MLDKLSAFNFNLRMSTERLNKNSQQNPVSTRPALDCWRVVSHFGGLTSLVKMMREEGVDLSADAVDKWRRRGNIPTTQLIQLAAIARKRGMRFDIYDFIKTEESNNNGLGKRAAG